MTRGQARKILSRKADRPARPELTKAGGNVWVMEVEDQMETQQAGHPASHAGAAAEVEKIIPAATRWVWLFPCASPGRNRTPEIAAWPW